MDEQRAVAANLANWESRVPVHVEAYGLDRYADDPAHLSSVVRFDVPALGDLTGRRVVHLQCHIGTDTVSLARLGAEVVGLDFSPAALDVARDLADRAGADVRFVEADVLDAASALEDDGPFDLVYTTVGVVNWIASLPRWAAQVASLLRPGGRLYLRDVHPMLLTLDETRDDQQLVLTHPYLTGGAPIRWELDTSYVGDGAVAQPVHYEWTHGLADVVQAVVGAGLTLERLTEDDGLDWAFAPWMELGDDGRYRLPSHQRALTPTEFTLEAHRPPSAT